MVISALLGIIIKHSIQRIYHKFKMKGNLNLKAILKIRDDVLKPKRNKVSLILLIIPKGDDINFCNCMEMVYFQTKALRFYKHNFEFVHQFLTIYYFNVDYIERYPHMATLWQA